MIIKENEEYTEDNHGKRRYKRCIYCKSPNLTHYIEMGFCECNDCKERMFESK